MKKKKNKNKKIKPKKKNGKKQQVLPIDGLYIHLFCFFRALADYVFSAAGGESALSKSPKKKLKL